MIEATNWMALLNHSDIDKSWLDWKMFMNIMEECIPKTTSLPRRNHLWLTKRLRQAIRRKNALYKRVKATGNFSKYRVYRNKALRQAKKDFFFFPEAKYKELKTILEKLQITELSRLHCSYTGSR